MEHRDSGPFCFAKPDALKGENQMTQPPEHDHRCEECGATFDSQVEWEQHNREVHSRYTCEHCQEHFDEVDEFESHSSTVHPERNRVQR